MNTALNMKYESGDGDSPKINEEQHGNGEVAKELSNALKKRPIKPNESSKPKTKQRLEDENVDLFSDAFKTKIRKINKTMDLIEEAYAKNSNCFDNIGLDGKKVFTGLGEEIRDLEQYLTASTRFLPDYVVKTCQQLLTALTNQFNALRSRLMPKKKFEFNSKKKKEPSAKLKLSEVDAAMCKALGKTPSPNEKKSSIKFKTSELSLEINDRVGEYICLSGRDVNKHDITLSDLTNCFVDIRGHAGSIRLKGLLNCVVLCGPTTFSVYGEGCQQTQLAIACQQLRLHFSTACKVFLHVTSRAIIEECRQIEIGRYNYEYDGLQQDFKDAGLDVDKNNYRDVGDFDWLSPDAPSPNWKLTEQSPDWNELRERFKEKANNNEEGKDQ